jgi:hypothetical protein
MEILGGQYGIARTLTIQLKKPVAKFTYAVSNMELLPVHLTTQNATTGCNVTYHTTIANIISTQTVLNTSITSGGIYKLKLVATNAAGSDSATETFRISPFLHTYKSFEGTTLNLYAWKVQIGSRLLYSSTGAGLYLLIP